MISHLITEIEAHLAWRKSTGRPIAETTLGRLAANDGKLVKRLRAGGQLTVAKAASVRDWMRKDRRAVANRPVREAA